MIKLTLREATSIPLEVDGILPETLSGLSELKIAKLPILHGRQSVELGAFFTVNGGSAEQVRFIDTTFSVKGIGQGMTSGNICVEGDAGMRAGAEMRGGLLGIYGNAGDWLGAEMSGGEIIVADNAGHCVGAAYRGSRMGMTGGNITVHGIIGNECGLLMRRGFIVALSDIGDFAGASIIAGTMAINGNAGQHLGAGMKRGTIIVFGECDLDAGFRYSCNYSPTYLQLAMPGIIEVQCYRGDILTGGKGEVLLPVNS